MTPDDLLKRGIEREFSLTFSRSAGPGGQNVNKVNTKAEVRFSVRGSATLSETEKEVLIARFSSKLTGEGELIVVSQSERSQVANRDKAVQKILRMLSSALTPQKKRKATSPTAASKEKRLRLKKARSAVKTSRRNREIIE